MHRKTYLQLGFSASKIRIPNHVKPWFSGLTGFRVIHVFGFGKSQVGNRSSVSHLLLHTLSLCLFLLYCV